MGAPAPALADEAGGDGAEVICEVETAVRMYFPADSPEGGGDDGGIGGGDSDEEAPGTSESEAPAQDEGAAGAVPGGGQAGTVGQASPEGEGAGEGATAETGVSLVAAGGSDVSTSWALAPLSPGTWSMALTAAFMAVVAAALAVAAVRQGE